MPLTRRGSTSYGVFFVGLSCAAASLALLQLSSDLYLLIIARALQGLAAAAITRASAGMLASTANNTALWLTPALVQNAGMTAAPFIAGLLHDHYNANAVFYCGYTLIFLNILLGLAAFNTSAARQLDTVSDTEDEALLAGTSPRGYGTMPSGQGRLSTRSRSISPTSPLPLRSPAQGSSVTAASWSPRLLVALLGYLVVGLLTSALHSVLPLFVQRHFNWSVSQAGYLFVPLSAPAAIIGPLSGMFTAPVPRSTRFLTTVGFLAYVPAFLYLGQLTKNTELVRQSFLLTLCNLSVATGLSAEPLVKEIANALGSSASDSSIATAQATSFSNTANAWGSLVGPLLAGFVSELWGWQAMTKTLGVVAATSGVGSLLFLQGWIGNPYPDIGSRRLEARSDEESAPLLANEQPSHNFYGRSGVSGSKQDDYRTERQNSDDVSPRARKNRGHRRHFSVDNFSVTTTTAGSMDSSTSSVRFQAALETPAQGPRPETSDSACKASSERRYVMREAPHAPSTDPLLAAGSLYVIDEERDTNRGVESQRQKRRVVVFPEGSAPPELLERHRHHIVAINALDGTAQMVSDSTDNHAVHVTEEAEADEGTFSEATCRRYVVVVVEGEDYESV
jgi:MFS family permease